METVNSLAGNTNTNSLRVEEAPDFFIEEDGNGGKYRVMNLDHPKWAKFEGMVELTPLKIPRGVTNPNTGIAPTRHESHITLSNFVDKKTKYFVGIPTGRDEKGKIIWSNISFKGTEWLDLSDRDQRRKFVIFLHSPFYKKSPNFQLSCKNVYDIVDREAQNEQFFVERNQRLEAGAVAARLRGEELTDMALALGFDPNTMTKSDLTRKVVEFAESSERDRKTGKTGSQMFWIFGRALHVLN